MFCFDMHCLGCLLAILVLTVKKGGGGECPQLGVLVQWIVLFTIDDHAWICSDLLRKELWGLE
jgi:hypothetical protein